MPATSRPFSNLPEDGSPCQSVSWDSKILLRKQLAGLQHDGHTITVSGKHLALTMTKYRSRVLTLLLLFTVTEVAHSALVLSNLSVSNSGVSFSLSGQLDGPKPELNLEFLFIYPTNTGTDWFADPPVGTWDLSDSGTNKLLIGSADGHSFRFGMTKHGSIDAYVIAFGEDLSAGGTASGSFSGSFDLANTASTVGLWSVTWGSGSTQNTGISGGTLQSSSVPEPSTVVFFLAGIPYLWTRRRHPLC